MSAATSNGSVERCLRLTSSRYMRMVTLINGSRSLMNLNKEQGALGTGTLESGFRLLLCSF